MRIVSLLLVAAALPASAQVNVLRVPGGGVATAFGGGFNDAARVAIGVTTTSSTSSLDTLGVLVTSVRTGSPADKAGIGEGDRIASIDGVSLKLAPADIDEYEMAGAMSRRLTRELNKLKVGTKPVLDALQTATEDDDKKVADFVGMNDAMREAFSLARHLQISESMAELCIQVCLIEVRKPFRSLASVG